MDFNFDTSTISSVLTLDPGSSPLTVLGVSGLILPAGTTLQRVADTGILRFNTDTSTIEGWNGASWITLQSVTSNLTGLSNLSGTGFISQTGTGTFVERAITGTAGTIEVANGNGVSGAPTITLANVGTSGTYVSVTTDAFGRVASGSSTQAWSTLTATPTSVSGYGILDAVTNTGNTPSISSGLLSARPAAGTAGRLYIATDTNSLFRDTGSVWSLVSPAVSGDGNISAGGTTLTLGTVNTDVGTYGSTTTIPVLTVNGKGLITAVTTASISGAITLDGDVTGTGSTGGNVSTTLATVNSNVGQFGDATHVPQYTVNAKGLITASTNVAIANGITISGDATGSGTIGSNTAITLNTVNSNVGFFGSNAKVATFTVNAKGLVTAAGNVTITPAAIGAINIDQLAVANGVATLGVDGRLSSDQTPAALVGAMVYQGVWNANTNSPALADGTGTLGHYYKVSVAGSTSLGGNSVWTVGDMVVYNGTTWDSIDGLTTEVTSVFGRVGAVTATLASTDFANQGTTVTVLHGNANGAPSWGAVSLSSDVTGTLPVGSLPALGGDISTSVGGNVTTLATVNTNTGMWGDSTHVAQFVVNGKGLVTAASNVLIPNTITINGDGNASVSTGGTGALTLATVNANVGTYGSTTQVPVVTVNGKGLVTGISTATITGAISVTGGDLTMSGSTGSAITNATLATVNTDVGSYGSTTQIPVITVNGKGLVTGVTTASISGAITVVGDATGTGTTGGNTSITLNTVNSNVGQFGDATHVPQFTVNAKGLVTAVGNIAITSAGVGAVTNAGNTPSIQSGTFAGMPAAGTLGRLYVTSDTNMIYRDSGAAWVEVGEAAVLFSENPVSPTASTVSGTNAVTLGSGNTAAGTVSFATGSGASTAVYGAEVRANGSFTAAGDAQTGKYVLRNITSNNTQTEVFLDGASARIVLPNNSAVTYTALVVGQRTDATGSHGAWKIEGLVARDANAASTALVGNRSKTVLTRPSGWDAEVFADTVNGALTFKVTGSSAQTVRWVVTVVTSEVTN